MAGFSPAIRVAEATTWPPIDGERSFPSTLAGSLCCNPRLPLVLFAALLFVPVASTALSLWVMLVAPVLTLLLLFCYTRPQQWGNPYDGFVLWVQNLHLANDYLMFRSQIIQGRMAYAISDMLEKGPLKKKPIPFGWGLETADYSEEEQRSAVMLGFLFPTAKASARWLNVPMWLEGVRLLFWSFPLTEQATPFAPGEDPVAYVMKEMMHLYPAVNQVLSLKCVRG